MKWNRLHSANLCGVDSGGAESGLVKCRDGAEQSSKCLTGDGGDERGDLCVCGGIKLTGGLSLPGDTRGG